MWLNMLFRYAAPLGWLLFGSYQADVFQCAESIEEKLNIIFQMLHGGLLVGVIVMLYLDHLLRRQEQSQQTASQKDFSA